MNDFIDHTGRDYSLKSGAPAIDAGIHIKEITDDTVGLPDIGAIEFGKPKWTVGADLDIPDFLDEEKSYWSEIIQK